MAPTRPVYFVRGKRQLAALAAAARQEVVDVLAEMGSVSVAELAAALGRPADALYFHLRALARAGLVKLVPNRTRNGRKEALYRTVSPQLQLRYAPRSAANRKAISAIVASMLRLGTRDFTRALAAGNVIVSGSNRELWALRKAGRLSIAQLATLNRRIQAVGDSLSACPQNGRLYAVTLVLTPLDHRNKTGRVTVSHGKRRGKIR